MTHRHPTLLISMLCVLLFTSSTTTASTQERTNTVMKPDPYQSGVLFFGQLFADYAYQWTAAEQFNAFALRRAELGLGYDYKHFRFIINTETIRSAGPQSLFGVDNNSLVFRVKHAFAQWTPPKRMGLNINIQGGMIPDVWVAQVEQDFDLRGINTILSEGGNFYDTSDLGASVGVSAYHRALELNLSLTNGEGRNERELNTGKNATAVLSIRPNQFLIRESQYLDDVDIALHLSYRDGSIGFSSLANHRWGAALTARWARIFAGAEFIHATGYGIPNTNTGLVDGRGVGTWLNGAIYPKWLGAAVMYRRIWPDTNNADVSTEWVGGLYFDAIDDQPKVRDVLGFPRLRLYLTYRQQHFDANISPVPGNASAATTHAVMLTLSARDARKLITGNKNEPL